jgi:hypothetical protein
MDDVIKQLVEIIASGGISGIVASILLGFTVLGGFLKMQFSRIFKSFKDIDDDLVDLKVLLELIKERNTELNVSQTEVVFALAINKCFRQLLKNYYELQDYLDNKNLEEMYDAISNRVCDESAGVFGDLEADLSVFSFKNTSLDRFVNEEAWMNDWNHLINEVFNRIYLKTNNVKGYLKNKESRIISEFKIKVK